MELELYLTRQQAEELKAAVARGEFERFRIKTVEVIQDAPRTTSQIRRDIKSRNRARQKLFERFPEQRWKDFVKKYAEGDIVSGKILSSTIDGLVVNVGVRALLPESQVSDMNRVDNINELIGKKVECRILTIDKKQRQVVLAHVRLIEDHVED